MRNKIWITAGLSTISLQVSAGLSVLGRARGQHHWRSTDPPIYSRIGLLLCVLLTGWLFYYYVIRPMRK